MTKKKNNIEDLRNHLFETIEDLRNKKIDIARAKAIGGIAQVIVNSASAEVRFLHATNGVSGSGFIPYEPRQPLADDLPEPLPKGKPKLRALPKPEEGDLQDANESEAIRDFVEG